MSNLNTITLLKRPIVTEKATQSTEDLNVYVFEVSREASKIEIKRAVEMRFAVSVKEVRTIRIRGKVKRLGRYVGRRPEWKKAMVTLHKDNKIEYVEGA